MSGCRKCINPQHVYDPRVKPIHSLNFNLVDWQLVCPAGYEQRGRSCFFKEIPYPSFYNSHDPFKAHILHKLANKK